MRQSRLNHGKSLQTNDGSIPLTLLNYSTNHINVVYRPKKMHAKCEMKAERGCTPHDLGTVEKAFRKQRLTAVWVARQICNISYQRHDYWTTRKFVEILFRLRRVLYGL